MTAAVSSKEPLWTKNFLKVFCANFITVSSGQMLTSPYALYLTSLGGTEMDIGVAAFVFAAISLITKPIAAWFLDNRSRKGIYFFGALGCAGVMWFYAIAPLVMLIMIRGVHGGFMACLSNGSTTNGYDTINPKRFSEGVGYLGFSNAMATTIMPLAGLKLYGAIDPKWFFIVISGTVLVAAAIMSTFKYEKIERKPAPNLKGANIIDFVVERKALPPSVLTAFAAVVNASISNYVVLYLDNVMHVGFDAGLYFTMQGLGTFISRIFMGRVMDKKGEEPIIVMCSITLSLGLVGVIYANIPVLFFIGAFMIGVSLGMTATCMQIMSVRSAPTNQRAKAASTYMICWELFAALGGLVGGALITLFGSYKTMFWILTVMGPLYYITYKLWVAKTDCAFKVIKAREKAEFEARMAAAAEKKAKEG